MSQPPRPDTPLDLEVLLHDHLPRLDLEKYFEIEEDEHHLFLKIIKYLDPKVFTKVRDLVNQWNGEYQPAPEQTFVIPKEPTRRPEDVGEDKIEGVIQRVETLADQNWIHVYIENVSKPLAIRPERVTPALNPGNRISAQVSIGELWLFIKTFHIIRELPSEKEPGKGYFAVSEGKVIKAPTDALVFGKFWVRTYMDPHELSRLRESIRRRGDVTYPLAVRPIGASKLEILGGHRRARTAKEAGVKEVSVRVFHPKSEAEAWEIACQDEMHESWSPIAYAKAYNRMKQDGLSIEDISLVAGNSTRTIQHHLNLLRLPESVQEKVDTGKLSASHAEELVKLEDRPRDLRVLATKASQAAWTRQRLREEIDRISPLSTKEAQKGIPPAVYQKTPEIAKEGKSKEIPAATSVGNFESKPTPVHCENCNIKTFNPKDFHGHTLCPTCYGEAQKRPLKFEAKIKPKRPEAIDTGLIFECPECGYKATHIHHSPDKHTLQKVREF
jgi:ParB/RepB/Spo0J family partition protein